MRLSITSFGRFVFILSFVLCRKFVGLVQRWMHDSSVYLTNGDRFIDGSDRHTTLIYSHIHRMGIFWDACTQPLLRQSANNSIFIEHTQIKFMLFGRWKKNVFTKKTNKRTKSLPYKWRIQSLDAIQYSN